MNSILQPASYRTGLFTLFMALAAALGTQSANASFLGDEILAEWANRGGVPPTTDSTRVTINSGVELSSSNFSLFAGESIDFAESSITGVFTRARADEQDEIFVFSGFDWRGETRLITAIELVSSTDGSTIADFEFHQDPDIGATISWRPPADHTAGNWVLNIVTAPAAPTSVEVDVVIVGTDENQPRILVVNGAPENTQIEAIEMTIGDEAYNFDSASAEIISDADGNLDITLLEPDTNASGGVRSDLVSYYFYGFDGGDAMSFRAEIDVDDSDQFLNYRDVFFNNGTAPNASVNVTFWGPTGRETISGVFPDAANASRYLLHIAGSLGEPQCGNELVINSAIVPGRNYLRDNLFDMDSTTPWLNRDDRFFTLVLDGEHLISCVEVEIRPESSTALSVYVDEVLAGTYVPTGNDVDRLVLPSALFGQNVRVESTDGTRWFRVYEARVFGD